MNVKVLQPFYYDGKLCDKGDVVNINDSYLLSSFLRNGKVVEVPAETPKLETKEDALPALTKRAKK